MTTPPVISGHDWRVVRILPRFQLPRQRVGELVDAVRDAVELIGDAR